MSKEQKLGSIGLPTPLPSWWVQRWSVRSLSQGHGSRTAKRWPADPKYAIDLSYPKDEQFFDRPLLALEQATRLAGLHVFERAHQSHTVPKPAAFAEFSHTI
jgi:hypothetical protein